MCEKRSEGADLDDYVTSREAAQLVGICREAICARARRNPELGIKKEGRYRINRKVLEQLFPEGLSLEDYVSVSEAACYANVALSTMHRYARQNPKLKVKIGKHVFIRADKLEDIKKGNINKYEKVPDGVNVTDYMTAKEAAAQYTNISEGTIRHLVRENPELRIKGRKKVYINKEALDQYLCERLGDQQKPVMEKIVSAVKSLIDSGNISGATNKEIAEHEGIPLRNVRATTHRAVKQGYLEKNLYDYSGQSWPPEIRFTPKSDES